MTKKSIVPMYSVTIAALNYLPRAELLAKSYAKHNPNLPPMMIFLVDATAGEIPATDTYTIGTPEDLHLESDEFHRMAAIYNITELCTALKAWVLEMLLDTGAEVVVYIDPDILIYGPMEKLYELTKRHEIVLTPHMLHPVPHDGLRPTETDIMLAGVFNLGFVSVSRRAVPMLLWWQERKRRDCIISQHEAIFVDQRWIDMVPSHFPHYILRDPSYNVAYWNVHERDLILKGDKVFAMGRPLTFFHFSGYSEKEPWALSKYIKDNPRVLMSENEALKFLCDDYSKKINQAALAFFSPSYRFNYFADGTEVVGGIRQLYRRELIAFENKISKEEPPEAFVDDDSAILNWLKMPVKPGSIVNRFLYSIWERRVDLQVAFPEPLSANESSFINWASLGADDDLIGTQSLVPVNRNSELGAEFEYASRGVNIVGYLDAELGIGELGRIVLDALARKRIPITTLVSDGTSNRKKASFNSQTSNKIYPVTVAVINADQTAVTMRRMANRLHGSRYLVGVWSWETEDFPVYPEAIDMVDEIWTISDFSREAIQKKVNKPVYTMPLTVKKPRKSAPMDLGKLGIKDNKPYFLFAFDFFSIVERKNPMGTIEAFSRAFKDGEGPILIIKAINGSKRRTDREKLRLACQNRSDIYILEDYLDRDDLDSLIANAIAYVSLHRCEGFGFTMAEAMIRGVPVIGTGYSGNMQFMNNDNSLIVPYTMINVGKGSDPYKTDDFWADPDIDVTIRHMQWVAANPEDANRLGVKAQKYILQNHSFNQLANFVEKRIEAALIVQKIKEFPAGNKQEVISLGEKPLRALENFGLPPNLLSATTKPAILTKTYRRVLHRMLRHYTDYERGDLHLLYNAAKEIDEKILQYDQTDKTLGAGLAENSRDIYSALSMLEKLKARVAYSENRFRQIGKDINKLSLAQGSIGEHLKNVDESSKEDIKQVGTSINRLDSELRAEPYMSDRSVFELAEKDGEVFMGYDNSSRLSNYADFEDIFRGSENFIKNRLEKYLPILSDKGEVVDIGCGRGELLSMLNESNIPSYGIDNNKSMVDRCHAKGLKVKFGDAIAELSRLKDDSIGAVTMIELIEHIPPSAYKSIFETIYRKLKPGGIILIETPNPHSPMALKAFWIDLTHIRPVYPESLIMLAKETGYSSAKVFFPFTEGSLDERLRNGGEYSLVASKATI